jgi:multidrug efflux pump subunit AcrB
VILLIGIVVNNAILLVEYIERGRRVAWIRASAWSRPAAFACARS